MTESSIKKFRTSQPAFDLMNKYKCQPSLIGRQSMQLTDAELKEYESRTEYKGGIYDNLQHKCGNLHQLPTVINPMITSYLSPLN